VLNADPTRCVVLIQMKVFWCACSKLENNFQTREKALYNGFNSRQKENFSQVKSGIKVDKSGAILETSPRKSLVRHSHWAYVCAPTVRTATELLHLQPHGGPRFFQKSKGSLQILATIMGLWNKFRTMEPHIWGDLFWRSLLVACELVSVFVCKEKLQQLCCKY